MSDRVEEKHEAEVEAVPVSREVAVDADAEVRKRSGEDDAAKSAGGGWPERRRATPDAGGSSMRRRRSRCGSEARLALPLRKAVDCGCAGGVDGELFGERGTRADVCPGAGRSIFGFNGAVRG